MSGRLWKSLTVLGCLAIFSYGLLVLDTNRGGPASRVSQCAFALARADVPPANILFVGSSRTGFVLDPLAIQSILRKNGLSDVTVERLVIAPATMRVSHALLETYLERRGAPDLLLFEATVMTPRSVRQIEWRANGALSEHFLLSRDANLMTYRQLLTQPAIAMPYTEPETTVSLWKFRLRSAVQRTGALVYQFAKAPFQSWSFEDCDHEDITYDPAWPENFSFAYGDFEPEGTPSDLIKNLRAEIEKQSLAIDEKEGPLPDPAVVLYPYDFGESYRDAEMMYISAMIEEAQTAGARVSVLPLTLYGYTVDPSDVTAFENTFEGVDVFDLYREAGVDFRRFWIDDAHIQKYPVGLLMGAIMARYLDEHFTSLAND